MTNTQQMESKSQQSKDKIYSLFEVEKRRYKKKEQSFFIGATSGILSSQIDSCPIQKYKMGNKSADLNKGIVMTTQIQQIYLKWLFLIPAFILWGCFFILLPHFGKLLWSPISDYVSQNIKILYAPVMTIFHTGLMLTWYGLFSICYIFKIPIFEKWRANKKALWPWEKDPKDWAEQKKKTYKCLAFHHLVIFPIILLIDSNVMGLKYKTSLSQFPTILEFFTQICICMLAEDFGFFWSHYILHHPKLYNKFHKKHHEFNNPYSIVAEYCNVFEYIFGNLLPSTLGIKMLGPRVHIFTAIGWMIWRTYTTAEVHSGYEVPFSPLRVFPLSGSTYFHDFHHSHNSGAYGSYFVFWDHLMNSDKEFLKYRLSLKEDDGNDVDLKEQKLS